MLKNKLKSWRHKHEMTQKEFAAFLGVNYSLYNRWERREVDPSLEWYWRISKILNCTIEELIEEFPDP